MKQEVFGYLPDGREVRVVTLESGSGATARVMNYGGTLLSLTVPDRGGVLGDVVLGFDSLEGYLGEHPYICTLVGRYGNRIREGTFSIDGQAYTLACNLPPHHLHGGIKGFGRMLWDMETHTDKNGESAVLRYRSPDGEEGYPGALDVQVTYTFTPDHTFRIEYQAHTDATTVVNLTHHAYFNLACGGGVLRHEVTLFADHITDTDAHLIPNGKLLKILGTPLDFSRPEPIGRRIQADFQPLRYGSGYDHNYVINQWNGALRIAARVHEPLTGRTMEVYTTQPGIQFYTANHLHDLKGKAGVVYQPHSGFCLESQHFPDSPNRPEFPSTLLKPGETYRQKTEYRFPAGG
ncbi:MAG: galactose mutarotase [Bacteroidetes bacterium]|nr:MAG: galactose mutarotase [Bacteroidota bacterium]